ncbi:MAG TPA: TonB-dependent receptor [Bacteroidales bacterium]|nr:TonB-dependent receptor [Bacteroidales bacterium]
MKRTLTILFLLLFIFTNVFSAENEIELELDTLKNFHLDEVVISGTRWQQSSSNIASKIIQISPATVGFHAPQTTADLLTLSGKVYMQKSQQGGGSPMIRGFATNRLLYTVDDVRMNTAIFRSGNIQNVISIDPYAIENTEVLFGPNSVIYGSDAIGGVMSFQTLQTKFSNTNSPLITGSVSGKYATANSEKTAHFDINIGWKKWALLTSISSFNFDDLLQGSRGPKDYIKPFAAVERIDGKDVAIANTNPKLQSPSGYSQFNLMQKVSFKPSAVWTANASVHYSETSPYSRYDRHLRTRNNLPRYSEWNYGNQIWGMYAFDVSHSQANMLYDQAALKLAVQNFEESRIDRNFNSDIRTRQTEKVDAYSANLDFEKKIGGKDEIFYGLEWVYNHVNSFGSKTNISTKETGNSAARYPISNWHSVAAFVSNHHSFNKKLKAQAGLRYNAFSLHGTFDKFTQKEYTLPFDNIHFQSGALTGNLGLIFRPDYTWAISTNLSTGFRSPNVDDMGKIFDSAPGIVVVPNANLKAEYATNIDLSVVKILGDIVKLDLTGYYTFLNNALVRRPMQFNGQDSILYKGEMSAVEAVQNAATARVYGLQAGLEVKIAGGFSASTDLNFQKGIEELDNGEKSPSRHAAPFFGVSRINYQHGKLKMQLNAQYQAEKSHEEMPHEEKSKTEIYAKDENGNTFAPAWWTLNYHAQYQICKNLSITAGIENILDKRYRPYSSGISAPGRNFLISIKATF